MTYPRRPWIERTTTSPAPTTRRSTPGCAAQRDALDPRPAPVVQAERVGEAAQDVLARLETLQHELDRLLGGLRGTAETLSRRPDDDASPGR